MAIARGPTAASSCSPRLSCSTWTAAMSSCGSSSRCAALAADGELSAFQHEGFWQPMDTLRDRRELRSCGIGRCPMADVGMSAVDPAFWRERRVLLTGHTGFKGAWLSLWLQSLGARVTGFAVDVPTQPVAVRAGEGRRGHGEHRGRRARSRGDRGGGRGGNAGGRHPHGGAVARAPLLCRAARRPTRPT